MHCYRGLTPIFLPTPSTRMNFFRGADTRASLAFAFVLLASLAGCGLNDMQLGNLDIPDYEPELALPLGESSYTMIDLVSDLQDQELKIEEAEDRFLSIVYTDTAINQERQAFLYFPTININDIVYPSVAAGAGDEVRVFEFEETFSFSFDPYFGERVDSIFFSTGELALEVASRFRNDVALTFYIPGLTDQGTSPGTSQPTVLSDTVSYISTVPVTSRQRLPLAGKKLVLERSNGSNRFEVIVRGKIVAKAGQGVDVSDFFRFTMSFSEVDYGEAHGYFDEKVALLQNRSINLKFFEKFSDYGLEFKDPRIRIQLSSSFGFPSGLLLSGMSAVNSQADSLPLTGSVTDSLQFIDYPGIDSIGATRTTEVVINAGNSNIRELFGITPVRFNLPLTIVSNPRQFEPEEHNFITAGSQYTTVTIVELPFEVRMQEFVTNLRFGLKDLALDRLENIVLRFYTKNQMPFDGSLLIRLYGASDSAIYEVPQQVVLQAPEVDPNGRSTASQALLTEIDLGAEGTAALKRARYLGAAIVINSFAASDSTYVKLYADYTLDINISALGKLKVKNQ